MLSLISMLMLCHVQLQLRLTPTCRRFSIIYSTLCGGPIMIHFPSSNNISLTISGIAQWPHICHTQNPCKCNRLHSTPVPEGATAKHTVTIEMQMDPLPGVSDPPHEPKSSDNPASTQSLEHPIPNEIKAPPWHFLPSWKSTKTSTSVPQLSKTLT